MNKEMHQTRYQVLWGVLIVAFGVVCLVDFDIPRITQLWRYWPFVFAAFGLVKMIPPTTPKHLVDGACQVMFAAWFYASFEHLWGLSFHTSWPIVIIIAGFGMLMQPVVIKYTAKQEEK